MNQYLFEELFVGMTESFEVSVTEEMVNRFCWISGDINPLHTDPSYAKRQGFPGCVVYGMLTASFYSTLAGVYLPGKYCLLQEVESKFHAPVFVGDHLTFSGSIVELHDVFQRVKIKAVIRNQAEKRVSSSIIFVGLLSAETEA